MPRECNYEPVRRARNSSISKSVSRDDRYPRNNLSVKYSTDITQSRNCIHTHIYICVHIYARAFRKQDIDDFPTMAAARLGAERRVPRCGMLAYARLLDRDGDRLTAAQRALAAAVSDRIYYPVSPRNVRFVSLFLFCGAAGRFRSPPRRSTETLYRRRDNTAKSIGTIGRV